MRVIAILVDKKGKTIGARITDERNFYDLSTEQLRTGGYKFDNADVNKSGFVRAKAGNLQKCVLNTHPTMREQSEILGVNKLLDSKIVTVYHGTKNADLRPLFGKGKVDCDYGRGFYTTPVLELAKEWAWSGYAQGDKGYVYTYQLDTAGLNILNLTEISSLHWVAELLANRMLNNSKLNEITVANIQKFINKYKLDTSDVDIIIGYRADDSYFSYAEGFVSYQIYMGTLESALRLGNLGIQVCVKSKKAFRRLHFKSKDEVDKKYANLYIKRDRQARAEYDRMRVNQVGSDKRTILDFI